jgi:hypothetical protein
MYRIRIGLIAAALILVATGFFYISVTSDLRASATQDVEAKVSRAQWVYQRISRLVSLDLANLAAERGRAPGVIAAYEKTEETALRQAAFEQCESLNATLEKEHRRADILALLDSQGKIIARNLNPNADVGEDLRSKYPAVGQALKGTPVKDLWTWRDGGVHVVALAPVNRPNGTIAGAILMAWVVSAKTAQESRDLLGTEIAYFHAGKVHTSSFVSAGDASKEDVAKTQALGNFLFSGSKLAETTLSSATPTPVGHWVLEGRDYAVVAASMPGNFADKTSGFAILASLSDGMARVQAEGTKVLLLGLLAVLIALGAAAMTARRFIAPLDQIELGVAEIINTNIDYTFRPVGPDFEGLSNSLNVMLARLLGRDEPSEDKVEDEEEGGNKTWKSDLMNIDGSETEAPANTVAALSQESEAAYYPRLFNEYVNALRQQGHPTQGLSVQSFMAKLSLAEAGLREKWECKSVRFQLVFADGELLFRPVKIA